MHPTRSMPALGLAGWLLASFVAGGIGGAASVDAAGFYGQLVKPPWAPPAWPALNLSLWRLNPGLLSGLP